MTGHTEITVFLTPEGTLAVDQTGVPHIASEQFVVGIWRDEESDGELHVSVHTPERILLSIDCGSWEGPLDESDQEADLILNPRDERTT